MLEVLVEVVVPVFLVAIVGGLAGRRLEIDVTTLSRLVLHLFSPALVFTSLSTIAIPATELAGVVAVTVAVFLAHTLAGRAWAWARRADRPTQSGVVLAASMGNQGNLGLPMSALAFGAAGFDVAVVVYVAGVVLWSSLGIALASVGRGTTRQALTAPLRYPAIYAAALGALVNVADLELPTIVAEPVATLAAAAIPVMLVVLGLQFRLPRLTGLADPAALAAVRLVAGPLVALPLTALLGVTGVAADATILQAAMPTAVMSIVVAAELESRADLVASTVVVSTIASGATLAGWIGLLR